MPRRVIMRRRNNVSLPFVLLLTALFLSNSHARGGTASQATATPEPAPKSQSAANSKSDQNSEGSDSGVFVFRKQVEEVVLHATVIDDKQRIVTTLKQDDFNIYENGSRQTIISFRHEDIPVAMGIVVDNRS